MSRKEKTAYEQKVEVVRKILEGKNLVLRKLYVKEENEIYRHKKELKKMKDQMAEIWDEMEALLKEIQKIKVEIRCER